MNTTLNVSGRAVPFSDTVLTCGTNAFNPHCQYRNVSTYQIFNFPSLELNYFLFSLSFLPTFILSLFVNFFVLIFATFSYSSSQRTSLEVLSSFSGVDFCPYIPHPRSTALLTSEYMCLNLVHFRPAMP